MASFFIDRPIFAWVVSIVILLMGLVSLATLPVAEYPEITPPTVQVTCVYPGADAQVVTDSVAAPIEQQVNGVERMMYMSSQSTNDGAYNLTITFELGTDLNFAQVLVQNRVALAQPQLPTEVQVQGISVKKKSPAILLAVNINSPDGRFDDIYLSNYATIKIKDELLRLRGVGDITYLGQRDYSMRVWLDPDKMQSLGLSASDVSRAVQNQNVQVAAGQIGQEPVPKGQTFQFTMSTLGRLEEVEQFGAIVVKTGQGTKEQGKTSSQVVRLRDVARIELGAQQYDQICKLDGKPSVGLAVFQLPGSNALETAELVKKKMKELKKRFPEGLDYSIAYDTTPFIEQSIEEVFNALRDAIILVAIVVLLFLQDWKAMILPMIDVPVSLIGTFAVMSIMGFSLNNISLLGLVLVIGIVVDDAIVVLENIERWIAKGLDARSATLKAMGEITGPIIAITLVLCSVFLPAIFIPGIPGQFFRQFALVIASSMIISAINAMTLTPARAVAIFKSSETGEHGREALPWWIFGVFGGLATYKILPYFLGNGAVDDADETSEAHLRPDHCAYFCPGMLLGGLIGWFIIYPVNRFLSVIFKGFNKGFDKATLGYSWSVGKLLRVSLLVLVVYGGLLYSTYASMAAAPTGFIPDQDQGYLLVNVQMPDSLSVQKTEAVMEKIDRIALGDDKNGKRIPGVDHVLSISGQSFLLGANGSNFGSAFIILDPYKKRLDHDRYDEAIAQKLRDLCADQIDEAVVTIFRAPPVRGLGNAGGFKFQVEQQGYVDLKELQVETNEAIKTGLEDKRLNGMFTLYRAETPQLYVDIDRVKCESIQVDVKEVFSTLQIYMGGQFVNLFNRFGRTWQVILMADPSYRTQADFVRQLKVRNRAGQMVPLGTLATVREIGGPVLVNRYNMYLTAAVNGNTAPGVSSGEAIDIIEKAADAEGVTIEWTEIMYLQIQAGSSGLVVFGLGSLLVFLVLSAKYESWSLPLSVILVVPMCLLSATLGVLIAHLDVNIFVQVGFIVLVGMAAKNAILIVEFARSREDEGVPRFEATIEACHDRLRPIVMTSLAFILGVVPLVLGHGAGAEMRHGLGVAVFAGMLGVTLFGIFLTPVFYYAILNFTQARKLATSAGGGPAAPTGCHATAVADSGVAERLGASGAARGEKVT